MVPLVAAASMTWLFVRTYDVDASDWIIDPLPVSPPPATVTLTVTTDGETFCTTDLIDVVGRVDALL